MLSFAMRCRRDCAHLRRHLQGSARLRLAVDNALQLVSITFVSQQKLRKHKRAVHEDH